MPKVEVSVGELLDKWTILIIKYERIQEEEKLANVTAELDTLKPVCNSVIDLLSEEYKKELRELQKDLYKVNTDLWQVEDALREIEKDQEYMDPRFNLLARKVYKLNDERAKIKRDINILTNSRLIEEKSYAEY